MPTLYDIVDELRDLEIALVESGGDADAPGVEDMLADYFEASGRLDVKVENYVRLIKELEARASARKEEATRLSNRAKVDAASVKSLKDRLMFALQIVNMRSIETPSFRVTVSDNGGLVPIVISSELDVPEEYTVVEKVVKINMDMIREKLGAGEELDFAHVGERGKHLRIS